LIIPSSSLNHWSMFGHSRGRAPAEHRPVVQRWAGDDQAANRGTGGRRVGWGRRRL